MKWTGRRLYKSVAVDAGTDGHTVTLDGRAAKTPAGRPLAVPGRRLARVIADEWAAQKETIRPDTMPLTQVAVNALDRVRPERAAVIDGILAYADTDLLCYRAEVPADLVRRQHTAWQPLLEWAAATHRAEMVVTTGIMPVAQPAAARAALREMVEAFDDYQLAALSGLTAATGSIIIALALVAGRLNAEEAFAASQVDETFQTEQWGADEEAMERRRRLAADIEAAARFLDLLGP